MNAVASTSYIQPAKPVPAEVDGYMETENGEPYHGAGFWRADRGAPSAGNRPAHKVKVIVGEELPPAKPQKTAEERIEEAQAIFKEYHSPCICSVGMAAKLRPEGT